VVEGAAGRVHRRLLVHGDQALLVFGEDPVAGRDDTVECLGEFLPLGGLHDQQAGVKSVLVEVADAVVAPTCSVASCRSMASRGSALCS
jgi:hypothetical protein